MGSSGVENRRRTRSDQFRDGRLPPRLVVSPASERQPPAREANIGGPLRARLRGWLTAITRTSSSCAAASTRSPSATSTPSRTSSRPTSSTTGPMPPVGRRRCDPATSSSRCCCKRWERFDQYDLEVVDAYAVGDQLVMAQVRLHRRRRTDRKVFDTDIVMAFRIEDGAITRGVDLSIPRPRRGSASPGTDRTRLAPTGS